MKFLITSIASTKWSICATLSKLVCTFTQNDLNFLMLMFNAFVLFIYRCFGFVQT